MRKRRLTRLINFRASTEDMALLAEVAKERGLTRSDFLRQAIYRAARQGQGRDGGQQAGKPEKT